MLKAVFFFLSYKEVEPFPNSHCLLVLLFSPEFLKKKEFSIRLVSDLKRAAVTQFVSRFLPSFCGRDILVSDILIASVWHVVRW